MPHTKRRLPKPKSSEPKYPDPRRYPGKPSAFKKAEQAAQYEIEKRYKRGAKRGK